VLLPHPLRPTMARNSPGSTTRFKPFSTCRVPKLFPTCDSRISAPAVLFET
jgi:hypothetical protein